MGDARDIASTLKALEEELLQFSVRSSAEKVSALLADEFVEFGSSGREWGKQSIIASLQTDPPFQYILQDFKATELAANVVLVTYRLTRPQEAGVAAKSVLRSSIWKVVDGRWQMIFHQGTSSNSTL